MRVLVNGLSARLGGGQTYLLNLLKKVPQCDEGWKVFVLCQDSLDLSHVPDNVERINLTKNLENPFKRAIWERRELGKLASELQADILFSPGGLLPSGSLPKGLKTAVTFQNMLPFDYEQRKRYPIGYRRLRDWLLERGLSSAMRKSDLVIFISQFAKDFIRKELGSLSGRTPVIPHGIDGKFLLSPDGPLPLPSDLGIKDYFLYVSFVDFYKSQIEVVRAFDAVRNVTGTTASLLLVGAENPVYGRLLREEIDTLGLADKVTITGNLPHFALPALYQNAQINLFASNTENCPNILLEMMASGRPALVSDRGPMPEFGQDDVVYFDPRNVEELTSRWIDMLNDPAAGETRAAHAISRIAAMNWDNVARSTWSEMDAICS